MKNKINTAKNNILNKTGININYEVIIKDWDIDDSYGRFDQFNKIIHINKNILENKNLLEEVIYHEFLHLYLQIETNLFYDILINRYTKLYFNMLNEYVSKYQIQYFGLNQDIICVSKQSNSQALKNQNKLKTNKTMSTNSNQFYMLSEFIIHNQSYSYIIDFDYDKLTPSISEMNKFVLELIKETI